MMKEYRGRIAPTPSGFLHIGHLATFKIACDRARAAGGKIVFRLEDLDRARCIEAYRSSAIEDLKNVGLDWDEGGGKGGIFAPYEQSLRGDLYFENLTRLAKNGYIYPCSASRSQIAEFGTYAPDGEPLFPESLRPKFFRDAEWICKKYFENPQTAKSVNWRFITRGGERVDFTDGNFGAQSFSGGLDFSDFLVWRKDGIAAYELAVVCDDSAMQITEVVRGADLLKSTARQILLYRALGEGVPAFYHCPLILGADGKKISKSGMASGAAENPLLIRNIKKQQK